MKLKEIYPEVLKSFKQLKLENPEQLMQHISTVKKERAYKNIEVRIAFDVARQVFPLRTICEWYDKYDCNDTHFKTIHETDFRKQIVCKSLKRIRNSKNAIKKRQSTKP